MACGLKVLVNVKEELEDRFTPEEILSLRSPEGMAAYAGKLEEVYNNACRKVISEADNDGQLYGTVSYFKDSYMDFEEAEESDGYGFGATKPDEIRAEILSWNRRNSMQCIYLLGEFEKLAAQQGFKSVSEMFEANMDGDGRICEAAFKYPASVYELRKALDCVDGVFTYGQDYLVFDGEYDIHPYASSELMGQAAEHPEDFLILEVYYD